MTIKLNSSIFTEELSGDFAETPIGTNASLNGKKLNIVATIADDVIASPPTFVVSTEMIVASALEAKNNPTEAAKSEVCKIRMIPLRAMFLLQASNTHSMFGKRSLHGLSTANGCSIM